MKKQHKKLEKKNNKGLDYHNSSRRFRPYGSRVMALYLSNAARADLKSLVEVHLSLVWVSVKRGVGPFQGTPSYNFGFRSSVQKKGHSGEGRHEGLVLRNGVLISGFIIGFI